MSGTDNVNNAVAPVSAEQRMVASADTTHGTTAVGRSPNRAQAILLVGAAAQLGLSLLITIYLARVLSPAAFGFFSLVGSTLILARKFLDPGFGDVAARDVARDAQRERPILEGLMAYRRVAGAVLASGVAIFALSQQGATERLVLFAVAIVLLLTEPAALSPIFQVRQAQGGPVLLNLAGAVLVLGGAVLFRRAGVGGAVFAYLLVAREATTLVGSKLIGERLLGYHPKPGFRGRNLKAFVAPALVFGLASVIYTIYFHCDVFFVYVLRGSDELGAYAAAFRPINPLLGLPWLLMSPLIPALSTACARDDEWFVRQVRGACAVAAGIGASATVAGVMLSPSLLQLLYRGRYLDGALSCVAAFRWLAIALGLVSVTTVITASLLAAGREKLLLTIGVSALLANAALNLVLLRNHDFTAAGFSTAVTELLFLLGAVIAFCVATRRSPLTWNSLLYLAPALIVAGLLHLAQGGPALRVSTGILLGLLAVLAILIMPQTRQLRRELSSVSPAWEFKTEE